MAKKKRELVTEAAHRAVARDRNAHYGEPADDFRCTAGLWQAYLDRIVQTRGELRIETWDIAAMISLVKISRLAESPTSMDHWVDIAGYAACGWECAVTASD
jgi:hypothetical protein